MQEKINRNAKCICFGTFQSCPYYHENQDFAKIQIYHRPSEKSVVSQDLFKNSKTQDAVRLKCPPLLFETLKEILLVK